MTVHQRKIYIHLGTIEIYVPLATKAILVKLGSQNPK